MVIPSLVDAEDDGFIPDSLCDLKGRVALVTGMWLSVPLEFVILMVCRWLQ